MPRDDDPPAAAADGAKDPEFKTFVGGISWHLDDAQLRETFADYNPTAAQVMLDRSTGRSRGFGFVWYSSREDMEAAIAALHGTEIDARKISVARAVPQSETAPGTPADALRRGERAPPGARYDR